jgi:membrane-associated protease RseP (regulator of RpoE activity)
MRLLLLLLLTLPLILLFLLPGGSVVHALWFWVVALVSIVLLWTLMGRPADDTVPAGDQPRDVPADLQPDVVRRHMAVDDAVELPAGVRVFRGTLRDDPDRLFDKLKEELPPEVVPMLQPDKDGRAAVLLIPRSVEEAALEKPVRPALHWLLFLLTFATTTFAGAAHQGVNLLREPERFSAGLPYSVALMAILGFHELGHYFTALRHGLRVTPPYFIPVPFALGTFGAFIQMRTPPESRRALFDVAVAGPLAGLVVAIPALYYGLKSSEIVAVGPPILEGLSGSLAQASILMSVLTQASLGEAVGTGQALRLSPLAFAGWLGLLVTALNLMPVGQLDGGHITRALLGTRAGMVVSWLAMMSLFALALFVWPGLLMWAILVFFLAGRGTPPLNDITPLPFGRKVLAVASFVILALILVPMPEAIAEHTANLRCPYL